MRRLIASILAAACAGHVLAQARADAPMHERALPGNVIGQRTLPDVDILRQQAWASPTPRARTDALPPEDPAPLDFPSPPKLADKPATPHRATPVIRRSATRKQPVAQPTVAETPPAAATLAQAWELLKQGRLEPAQRLFEAVLIQVGGVTPEAEHGLALIALQRNLPQEALRHIQHLPANHRARGGLLRDAYVSIAQARYAAKDYAACLDALHDAAAQAPLPRYARALGAWSQLSLGRADVALDDFAALYRETADQESAEGVLLAATRARREDALAMLASSEPLASMYRRQLAERAFAAKRFLLARQLDAERYGDIGGGSFAIAQRIKDTATLHTRIDWRPGVALRWADADGDDWRFHSERIRSSVTSPGSGISSSSDGTQARLEWRREDAATDWEAALGTTPATGRLGAKVEGLLARTWYPEGQYLRLAAYRQPVRDTALSYIGDGQKGQVLANGLHASWRGALADRWSASLGLTTERLAGTEVPANDRRFWEAGIGYDLRLPGFDYAVASLGYSEDRFDKNLGGIGIYFSPQKYVRQGPAFDFMTVERQPYLLKGRMAYGLTRQREGPDLDYGGTQAGDAVSRGVARDVEIGGIWQLSPSVQAGAWATRRTSPNYQDSALMFRINILFEPRHTVLSSDLPNAAAARLY